MVPWSDYSSPQMDPDDLIKAEGLEYITRSRCGCKVDKMIVPSALSDVPREETSFQTLVENMNLCNCRSISSADEADSSRHTCPTTHPHSFGRGVHSEIYVSPESDFPRGSVSEDAVNRDALRRCDHFKKTLIKGMQHKYNHKRPGPGRLAKCSCNSCWARNIELLSRGSVRPRDAEYSATRTGEICERIRSVNNVKFNKIQKTLMYDICDGEVFDINESRTDFSCVRKEVGVMRIEDSDSEESDDDDCDRCSSEDEEDIGSA